MNNRLKRLSQQIANGEQLIANQMRIVAGLERAGQPADHAKFCLPACSYCKQQK